MPPFEPRTAEEIRRGLLARLIATTNLTDLGEGSAESQLLGSVAVELASKERQLQTFRDSFYLEDLQGADLDYRVQELPPAGLTRHPAQAASGGGPVFTREAAVAALVIPEGSLFGRSDDTSKLYRLMADVTIPGGAAFVSDGVLQCTVSGTLGNVGSGMITTIVSAPAELLQVNNGAPMSNGDDGESDEALRARARAYLSSLGQSTPPAVVSMALNYRTAADERASFVALFEDPFQPAYSELLLDDGDQLSGRHRVGAVSGPVTVGNNAPSVLFHEAPATEPITVVGANKNLVVTRGGAPVVIAEEDVVSIPERGVVHLAAGVLEPGDIWTIGSGTGAYNVWTGLPAEIQSVIEGQRNSATNRTSFRGSGCRVRVVAPQRELIELEVRILPLDGSAYDAVKASTVDSVVAYMDTLLPGQPLYIAQLIDHLMDLGDLKNIRFYAQGSGGATCASDQYPNTARTVLRTTADRIVVVATGA